MFVKSWKWCVINVWKFIWPVAFCIWFEMLHVLIVNYIFWELLISFIILIASLEDVSKNFIKIFVTWANCAFIKDFCLWWRLNWLIESLHDVPLFLILLFELNFRESSETSCLSQKPFRKFSKFILNYTARWGRSSSIKIVILKC